MILNFQEWVDLTDQVKVETGDGVPLTANEKELARMAWEAGIEWAMSKPILEERDD